MGYMGFFIFVAPSELLAGGMWGLVPGPGIKPGPPALGARSLCHWTTKEVSLRMLLKLSFHTYKLEMPTLTAKRFSWYN